MKPPINHVSKCIYDSDGALVFAMAYYGSPEECRSALDQIVRAVNSHDELIDLLSTALVLVECREDEFGNRDVKLIADIQASIAKANGEIK